MYKTLAGLSLIPFLFSTLAKAEGMAGISVGQAFYSDNSLSGAYSSSSDIGSDSRGTSFKIHGGLPLSHHLSAHFGLYSLGGISSHHTNTITLDNNGTLIEVPYADVSKQLDNRGFFLEGRWQWRAGAAWRPYVKAGMAINTSEIRDTVTVINSAQPAENMRESRSSVALAPGIGMVYESLRHWGLQLELERYLGVKAPADLPDRDIDSASLGIYGYW